METMSLASSLQRGVKGGFVAAPVFNAKQDQVIPTACQR
jgi:hypothetical protein